MLRMHLFLFRIFAVIAVGAIVLGCSSRESQKTPPPIPFLAPVNYAVGQGPTCISNGDFNDDGKLDLVTCNSGSDSVSVLLGNGDGTFKDQIVNPTGGQPFRMVVGKFTPDSHLDLAIIHNVTTLLTILRGTGDGRFQELQRINLDKTPTGIITADFNGDQNLDIAVSLRHDRILIFSGSGQGFFMLTHDFDPGDTPTSIIAVDLNGDNTLDMVVANNGIIGKSIATFIGTGDGRFKKAQNKRTPLSPFLVRARDFSGDGILDLVIIYGERNTLGFLRGQKDGTYADPKHFGAEGGPADMVIGDYNHDGNLDLAVPNNLSHNLSIILGRGDGTFIQPPIDYGTQKVPFSVTSGAFSEGMPDSLAVANNGSASISVFLAKMPPSGSTGNASHDP